MKFSFFAATAVVALYGESNALNVLDEEADNFALAQLDATAAQAAVNCPMANWFRRKSQR